MKKSSSPGIHYFENSEIIWFLHKASNIRMPSFSGFAGLWRSEIKVSFKYSDYSFKLKEVWWAIEYLDDKLKTYLNSKD